MKLSIIIPLYNVEQYIEDCLQSIYHQNLQESDFEVLIINDGSTDNSFEIASNWIKNKNKKNVTIISQNNKGLSGARNTGIEKSKGKYIYFIDSDDYLLDNSLSLLLNYAEENNLDFCGFESNKTDKRYDALLYNNSKPKLDIIVEGNGIEIIANHQYNNSACMYLFDKKLLEKNNLRFIEGRNCEDGMFTVFLLLSVSNGVVFSNSIYQYFNNSNSIVTNFSKNEKMIDDMLFVVNYFEKLLQNNKINDTKALFRLRNRQESYLFFSIIRMVRSKYTFNQIKEKLDKNIVQLHSIYPFKNFLGYDKKGEILVRIFNNDLLFKCFLSINKSLNII